MRHALSAHFHPPQDAVIVLAPSRSLDSGSLFHDLISSRHLGRTVAVLSVPSESIVAISTAASLLNDRKLGRSLPRTLADTASASGQPRHNHYEAHQWLASTTIGCIQPPGGDGLNSVTPTVLRTRPSNLPGTPAHAAEKRYAVAQPPTRAQRKIQRILVPASLHFRARIDCKSPRGKPPKTSLGGPAPVGSACRGGSHPHAHRQETFFRNTSVSVLLPVRFAFAFPVSASDESTLQILVETAPVPTSWLCHLDRSPIAGPKVRQVRVSLTFTGHITTPCFFWNSLSLLSLIAFTPSHSATFAPIDCLPSRPQISVTQSGLIAARRILHSVCRVCPRHWPACCPRPPTYSHIPITTISTQVPHLSGAWRDS